MYANQEKLARKLKDPWKEHRQGQENLAVLRVDETNT